MSRGGPDYEPSSSSMVFTSRNNTNNRRSGDTDSSDEDNFEEGGNQYDPRSEIELGEVMDGGERMDRLVSEYANFNE